MFKENEVNIQGKLASEIRRLSNEGRFSGINISEVLEGFSIGASGFTPRQADIICLEPGHVPFLIIETKKEGKGSGNQIQPMDQAVIGQVLSYAYLYKLRTGLKPKAIMTANKTKFAAFIVPDNPEEFLDLNYVKKRDYERSLRQNKYIELLKNYLIDTDKYRLEDIGTVIAEIAAKVSKAEVLKPPVSKGIISLMNDFVASLSSFVKQKIMHQTYLSSLTKDEMYEIKQFVNGDYDQFARVLSYIFMNKIITYRLLEDAYSLPSLQPFKTQNNMIKKLNELFKYAEEESKDFVSIFSTGIFDRIEVPENRVVMDLLNSFINTLEHIDASNFVYYVGYTYENVIPPAERHKLGEFYTPGAIAELIARWATRSADDYVLDPGTGSGTFLSKAYRVFAELILGNYKTIDEQTHQRILGKLYGLDVNPFAIQLSAISLALHNLKASSNRVNLRIMDFFLLDLKTLAEADDKNGSIQYVDPNSILNFYRKYDTIIGNPPYTRWTEIDDKTKQSIKRVVSDDAKKYGIPMRTMPGRQGSMPGIYIYWLLHCNNLLKPNGRLGVIISDLWLQTSYGKGFQKFLLENYRITALIDFKNKVFEAPLVSTIVVLLEKESDESNRENNVVKFITVGENITVSELLNAIGGNDAIVNAKVIQIQQSRLHEQDAWFLFFKYGKIPTFWKNDLFVPLSTFFDVAKGNTQWHIEEAQGTGADNFFFLDESTARNFKMPLEKLRRAVRNTRDVVYFTLKDKDIEVNAKKARPAYFFTSDVPKDSLEDWARQYVKWGENPGCLTSENKGKSICSETTTCRKRKENKKYRYWYNLGYTRPPVFICNRYGWNKTRFSLNEVHELALSDSFLTFFIKDGELMSREGLLALLAYLNSTYSQFYIELKGRKTGGGAIALEVNIVEDMPVPDVRKLPEYTKQELASLFMDLDSKARELGGAVGVYQMAQLDEIIGKIDAVYDGIFRASNESSYVAVKAMVQDLMDKRRADSGDTDNPIIGTEREEIISGKRKRSRRIKIRPSSTLDKFTDDNT